jgi:hypothetical protein
MKKLLATAAVLSLFSAQAFAQATPEAAPVAPAPMGTTIAGYPLGTVIVAGIVVAAVAVAVSDSNSTTTHHGK